MAPVNFVFLANRGNLTKRLLYRDVRDRVTKEPGCEATYYDPNRVRPQTVVAEFDPTIFLEQQYATETCRLEVEFWYPSGTNYEYYKIEWVEPNRNLGIGWHQDQTHPSLGNCHFQIDYDGATVCRKGCHFIDKHPLTVLDSRLDQFRSLLPILDWSGSSPSLPRSGIPSPP